MYSTISNGILSGLLVNFFYHSSLPLRNNSKHLALQLVHNLHTVSITRKASSIVGRHYGKFNQRQSRLSVRVP